MQNFANDPKAAQRGVLGALVSVSGAALRRIDSAWVAACRSVFSSLSAAISAARRAASP
jgi:hypothetical protein